MELQRKMDFPEGFDVCRVIRDLSDEIGYASVVDFGCGRGRLCESFDPQQYIGVDIDPNSIELARKKFTEYRFEHIQENPHVADLYLACDVFLHMNNQILDQTLKTMRCKWLIVVEMLGKSWRKAQVPATYHRDLSEYLSILRSHDLILHKHVKHPFQKYSTTTWYQDRDTNLSFLVFKKCFRTPS